MSFISKSLTVTSFNKAASRITNPAEFIALCERGLREIEPAGTVRIDEVAIAAYAPRIAPATGTAYGWNDYISPQANAAPLDMARVTHEFAAITGQQGGFFRPLGPDVVRKWELNGSGAAALVAHMQDMRLNIGTPGYNGMSTQRARRELETAFHGKPFGKWRTDAMMEFMPANRLARTQEFLADITDVNGTLHFNLRAARKLGELFPLSYAGDPFAKKANLLLFMLAAHLDSRQAQEAVPSYKLGTIAAIDYRLPQALSAQGVGILKFHARLAERLTRGDVMQIDDPDVVKIRMAAAIATDKLVKVSGRSLSEVDGALWKEGRTLEKQKKALNPMRVLTTHF